MLALFGAVVLTGLALSWFIARSGHAVMASSSPLLRQQIPLLQQISELKAALIRQQVILNQYYALTLDGRAFTVSYTSSREEIRRGMAALGPFAGDPRLTDAEDNYRHMLSIGGDLADVLGQKEVDWDLARSKLNDLSGFSTIAEHDLDQLRHSIEGEVLAGSRMTVSRVALMTKLVAAYSTLIMLAALLAAEYIRLRYRAELGLVHQATHDALTGLGNRRKFEEAIAALGTSSRDVLLIAVERFQPVVSGLGYIAADVLLQELSQRLKNAMAEESAELFQFDGTSFAVLLPVLDLNGLTRLAQRIEQTALQPFRVGADEVYLSLSAGLASYPEDGDDTAPLLRSADLARQAAQRAGRRDLVRYSPAADNGAARRLMLEAELRHAIERRQLILHYQPQVEAAGGGVIGVEALLRWNRPGGVVSPLEFVPMAEDTGLIVPIGEWVLHTACREASNWQEGGGPPLVVAVNISFQQFRHPGFIDSVVHALRDSGLPAELLELEITENTAMQDGEQTISRLLQLKELGVRIAVDDFGTGYSSLAYLKRFTLDRLKIDQAFVRNLPQSKTDADIVKAIIKLGHSLGLQVLAEGVETVAQQAWLARHRCHELQGYLFARPLAAEDFAAWRAERNVTADRPHFSDIPA